MAILFKMLITLILVIVLLVAVYFAGPRYIIEGYNPKEVTLPSDLEAYLAEQDEVHPLKENVGNIILWADEPNQKTDISIIYLHGFSATRMEVHPLWENIAKSLGANLYMTRYTGSGSPDGEPLGDVGKEAWLDDTMRAYAIGERIGKRVIIAGTSHGALLGTGLAELKNNKPSLAGMILMSPNYGPVDQRTMLLTKPWSYYLVPLVFGSHRQWEPQNSAHAYYLNTRYPIQALFPMMAQVEYLNRSIDFEGINTPSLILYSTQDATVLAPKIEERFGQFGSESKSLVAIEDSSDKNNHILAGDILSPHTTERVQAVILQFIQEEILKP